MNLLIADDEVSIRKGLSEMDWQSVGLKVCHVAPDGRDALDAVKELRPDIILADINMPGYGGIDLAQYIHEHNLDCQIIFLSGYNDFKYAKSAIMYDVFDYILKPSDPCEIMDSVKRAAQALKSSRTFNSSVTCMRKELDTLKIADGIISNEHMYSVQNKTDKIIKDIFNYIEENYMKDISLVTLSNEIHFNSIYICRIIKKKTGHTFLENLMSVRMFHAAQLLVTTDYKISQIAEEIGINDQKYFSQLFKKTLNMTPNEYRKNKTTDSIAEIPALLEIDGAYGI